MTSDTTPLLLAHSCDCSGESAGRARGGSRGERQVGQSSFFRPHWSMQSAWKRWPQGVVRTRVSYTVIRQIMHSFSSSGSEMSSP